MTQTFTVNANNDIFINVMGNLSISYDLQATLQACAQAAKTRLGEMCLAVTSGLPFFETIWNGVPNLAQFELALRTAIINVSEVTDIISLTFSQSANILNYVAVINTSYGQGTING
jgi:hypothetical protein